MPDELENRSVRYFSTSKPLACAVEIIEYKMALHFAPLAVLLKSQFLPPTVNGLIAFSARLLSMGTSPSSRNVYRYFFSLSVYLTASTYFRIKNFRSMLAYLKHTPGYFLYSVSLMTLTYSVPLFCLIWSINDEEEPS